MPSVAGKLTSSGDSSALITPSSGTRVRVWSYLLVINAAAIDVIVKTGSTTKVQVPGLAAVITPYAESSSKEPLFEGAADETLKINLSGAAASGVYYRIWYSEVG